MKPVIRSPPSTNQTQLNMNQEKNLMYMSPSHLASPVNTAKRSARDLLPPDKSPSIDEKIDKLGDLILDGNAKLQSHVTNEVGKLWKETGKLVTDVAALKLSHSSMSNDINDLKQQQLNSTMEVSGISTALFSSMAPLEIFNKLLDTYQISCSVSRVYKREYKTGDVVKNLLVVNFHNYEEKLRVMRAKQDADKSKEVLIFFNHALTPTNRAIFMKARKVGKELKLQVSVAYGRIYIRRPGETRGRQLKSLEEIDDFQEKFQKDVSAHKKVPPINETQSSSTSKTQ